MTLMRAEQIRSDVPPKKFFWLLGICFLLVIGFWVGSGLIDKASTELVFLDAEGKELNYAVNSDGHYKIQAIKACDTPFTITEVVDNVEIRSFTLIDACQSETALNTVEDK